MAYLFILGRVWNVKYSTDYYTKSRELVSSKEDLEGYKLIYIDGSNSIIKGTEEKIKNLSEELEFTCVVLNFAEVTKEYKTLRKYFKALKDPESLAVIEDALREVSRASKEFKLMNE